VGRGRAAGRLFACCATRVAQHGDALLGLAGRVQGGLVGHQRAVEVAVQVVQVAEVVLRRELVAGLAEGLERGVVLAQPPARHAQVVPDRGIARLEARGFLEGFRSRAELAGVEQRHAEVVARLVAARLDLCCAAIVPACGLGLLLVIERNAERIVCGRQPFVVIHGPAQLNHRLAPGAARDQREAQPGPGERRVVALLEQLEEDHLRPLRLAGEVQRGDPPDRTRVFQVEPMRQQVGPERPRVVALGALRIALGEVALEGRRFFRAGRDLGLLAHCLRVAQLFQHLRVRAVVGGRGACRSIDTSPPARAMRACLPLRRASRARPSRGTPARSGRPRAP
jgi:hypothetical protein